MRYIATFLSEDKAYFANCKRSIAAQNNHMLFDGCILYSFVLAFYTVFSILTKQTAFLRNMYYVFDGVHLLLCIAVFTRPVRWKESFRATQAFCIVLESSILCFFALEGAMVSPTQHSLYVPIAILLLQLLFIHRAAYSVLAILFYTTFFAVLSCAFKTPEAAKNDVYIALATYISANIGYMLIAKLRRSEQQALTKFETLSTMDELTGLYNKATLARLCQSRILESDRACILAVMDLDDFKKINDAYGHDVGDEVLESVGHTIKRFFRAGDIMGRFGGDEFVILLDSCDDSAVARSRMEAFLRSVDELRFSVDDLSVRCSAGVSFKREGDDFGKMFTRADRALYVAKRDGKNRIAFETELAH